MAVLVEMPKANENMTEGTVGRWLVAEGERVEVETMLVEIITDKAVFELPSPAAGVLLRQVAPERSVVPVGYVIAIIGAEGEAAPDVSDMNRRIMAEHAAAMGAAPAAPSAPSGPSGRGGSGLPGGGSPAVTSGGPGRQADGDAAAAGRQTASPVAEGGLPMVRATPAARRVAKELGVDLLEVQKSIGFDRPVGEADVRAFAARSGGSAG
ncbi:MAG: E3 binding domain-containing protein [Planctomycetota bacterium]|nr:E3 binding domain-containing protein [Planctomycetota bacterium]